MFIRLFLQYPLEMASSLYRGRLGISMETDTLSYLSSLEEDVWIVKEDLLGSISHVLMLAEKNIINKEDAKKILSALLELWKNFPPILQTKEKYEDIHEYIENFVVSHAGIVGKRMHIGRSRNDQVALDLRLKVRKELVEVMRLSLEFMGSLLKLAEKYEHQIFPFYTHLQQAQLGLLSHYFLSYFDAFVRDFERLKFSFRITNFSPLGASAIAGTRIPLDRLYISKLLGFDGLIENSLDAVSSRDYMLDVLNSLNSLMLNISRMSEDIVIWSTMEFGFLEIGDEYSSVSSVMPQKKNPCVFEIARARCSKVISSYLYFTSILKGLPSGYNRDLQETKIPLINAFLATKNTLQILSKAVSSLKINEKNILKHLESGYIFAVDLAEILVEKFNIPFRDAHRIVGRLVHYCIANELKLTEIPENIFKEISSSILGKPIELPSEFKAFSTNPVEVLKKRGVVGSPSPKEISRMLSERKERLKKLEEEVYILSESLEKIEENVIENAKKFLGSSNRE